MKLSAFIAASALLLSACNGTKTSEVIDRMRVLAIQAEPATAHPGDDVRLTTLVVSEVRNDPAIEIVWYVCQYPSLEDCAKANDLIVIGHGPTVVVTIPETAFSGDDVVFFMDAINGDTVERSLKGIPVRDETEPVNHNPILDRVKWSPYWPLEETERLHRKDRLDIRIGSSEVMNEIWNESGDDAAEDVQLLTFTSGGTLVDPSGSGSSGAMYYRAPDYEGTYGAWVVANDGRGGVAWTERWFEIEGDAQP